jgi:hypothetical protein
MNNHIIYRVRLGTDWLIAKTAKELRHGFLRYVLSDGTTGLAMPGNWQKLLKDFYAK